MQDQEEEAEDEEQDAATAFGDGPMTHDHG